MAMEPRETYRWRDCPWPGIGLLIVLLMIAVSCVAPRSIVFVPDEPIAPLDAPFDMPELRRPSFPDRSFDIRDYGALGDGNNKNTEAIASAITTCADSGGGTVLIPPGEWLTGPIHLRSNVNLHVADGATLRFSTRFDDYLPVVKTRWEGIEVFNYSPLIYANGADNIAITGSGVLDGQGEAWWNMRLWQKVDREKLWNSEANGIPVEARIYGSEAGALRPAFVQPINCRKVLIEGVTFTRSPFWVIHPVYCEELIVRRVRVDSHGVNNDGIDPDSCRNVLIEYCDFEVGDDAVALKSGRDADGRRVGRPCENVVVRHVTSTGGHGGVVIGSELSGGVRNVLAQDIYLRDTVTAIRIKSKIGRGGVIENIWFRDIIVTGLRERPTFWLDALYASHSVMPASGELTAFRDIHVENLSSWGSERSIEIGAYPEQPAENITLNNVSISADLGMVFENTKGVNLTKVNVLPNSGDGRDLDPVITIRNCQDVAITGARCFDGTATYLYVEGSASRGITLHDNDLSSSARAVALGVGVSPDAVELRGPGS